MSINKLFVMLKILALVAMTMMISTGFGISYGQAFVSVSIGALIGMSIMVDVMTAQMAKSMRIDVTMTRHVPDQTEENVPAVVSNAE